MPTLELEDVTFGYGRGRPVLQSFSHEFSGGSTLLLGPNGAGKSTLLGLSASALRPSSGRISIGDLVAAGTTLRRYRRGLSWMPQRIRPMPGLTVREQVAYVGWLKGMGRDEAWARSLPSLRRVRLDGHAERRPRTLSGGELRRLGVAQTLVHDARWILMDEPTAGLDPAQRAEFQTLVHELRGQIDVVISTHQTDDIDTNYDWVVVLDGGVVRFVDSTSAFLDLGGDGTERERVVTAYQRALAGGATSL